ncbi:hypothetical protein KAR02_05930 [Candidatus Bipolaricaulota bacterium]|nr:hypothetical protein [Candidatus Bipolaricaulota bacterium]
MLRYASHCSAERESSHLALVALLVILNLPWECAAARSLSGEWESTIAVEPATGTWSIEMDCTIGIEFADWIAEARTLFEDGVWKSQEFDVEGRIGDFGIESDVRFEPYEHRFMDWIADFEWESDELAVTLTTMLTQTTDWLILELEREWEEVEIGTSFRLCAPSGSRSLVFYDVNADVTFNWCGVETSLEAVFDDDGFDEFVVEFSDLNLARIPWLTFDLEIIRTLGTTTVNLSPDVVLDSPWYAGTLDLEFEGSLPSEPNLLPISINEASLTWEIEEWEMVATAILDSNDWIDDLYWLELEVEATVNPGISGEVSLDLALLWTETSRGRALSVFTYEPGDMFSIAIECNIDLDIGQLDRLAVELQIEW